MKKEKVILIGAGGHCKVIIDIIGSGEKYEIIGITDKDGIGTNLYGIPIVGTDDELFDIYKSGVKNAFISLGALNNMEIRNKIYYNLKSIGYKLPILIHQRATVSPYVKVGEGTCVMAGAVINSGTVIGRNSIINTSSVIEHDCVIGNNCHVSPKAGLAGGVSVGNNSHIGIGANVIQGVAIGDNVIVGAGAVVIDDIKSNVTVAGVPSKIIKCR